jgi:hypothetical protein
MSDDVAKIILGLINKVIPDKQAQADAEFRLKKLQQDGELSELGTIASLNNSQVDVNKQEAKHGSIWVAGWRPGIGWICFAGLGWQYVLMPMATFYLAYNDMDTALPTLPEARILELTFAMLGFGGLRTYEKLKKIAK